MSPWIDVPQAPGVNRTRAQVRDTARAGYEIRNAASPDEAELLIYDEIDAWWGISASDVVSELAQVTAPNLRVRVNSPGGSVFEGLAIANALRAHPANVTVQVDGLAASIASVIAMAGDRLVMMPNSMMIIHDASGVCFGDTAEMAKMAEVLDIISDNISDVYAAKAGGTAEDWRAAMRVESWYKAADAVAAGLADEVADANKAAGPQEPGGDEPDMHARWDLAAYGYRGSEPERPKPGPPPVKAAVGEPAAPIALTINIGDAVSKQVIEDLRRVAEIPEAEAVAEIKVAIDGRDVSEHVLEPLRRIVQQSPDAPAEPVGTGQDGATPPAQAPPPAPEPAAPTPEPRTGDAPGQGADAQVVGLAPPVVSEAPSWADLMANLTKPKPDPWAEAMKNLTASSSATES